MQKTPQEFKRQNVKELFSKILRDTVTNFEPLSICASESLNDDFTTTEFSFQELGISSRLVSRESKGKGFVDGIFNGLYQEYIQTYPSLEKIKLIDIKVNPIMKASRSLGSDAKASVVFSVEVSGHGIAEFQHKSRSMIYSGFTSALNAFQFYINCERTFHKIQTIVENAKQRNRGDIIQECLSDLSMLTEVNTYEKKQD